MDIPSDGWFSCADWAHGLQFSTRIRLVWSSHAGSHFCHEVTGHRSCELLWVAMNCYFVLWVCCQLQQNQSPTVHVQALGQHLFKVIPQTYPVAHRLHGCGQNWAPQQRTVQRMIHNSLLCFLRPCKFDPMPFGYNLVLCMYNGFIWGTNEEIVQHGSMATFSSGYLRSLFLATDVSQLHFFWE